MKFSRILPEMWASTWCPFGSSTLNIAFGSGSLHDALYLNRVLLRHALLL